MIGTMPKFYNSPYFVGDLGNWHLKPGAPQDIVDEFENFMGIRKSKKTEKSFTVYKADEDKHLVFGWASVSITVDGEPLEDRQHDLIEPGDLENAAYEYVLNFRDTGEEHLPGYRKKGKLVESVVFTPEKQKAMGIPAGTLPVAWWVGFKIEDEDTWQRVKDGTYRMFSIEGVASREPVDKMPVAKTFDEIVEKFNPYHGKDGRFASANGATLFTWNPGASSAHDRAIAGEMARTMVADAKGREKVLTPMLQNTANEVGGEMVGLEFAVKTESSLKRKILSESLETGQPLDKAAKNMKDVNRYTMQLTEDNFVDGYNKTMKTMQDQGYEIVKVKNTLKDPTAEYRGVNTNLKGPDGQIFELQFHTAKSLEIKEPNHKLYEEQRLDTTTPERKAELGRLMAQNAASIPTPAGIETIQDVKFRP